MSKFGLTTGTWQYPLNPAKTIPGFGKPQLKFTAGDIFRLNPRTALDTNQVTVSEETAFKLAERSPNPQKATNAVYLLAGNERLKLMPLAALLFASAGR